MEYIEENGGKKLVKCSHCEGKGKCNCFTCWKEEEENDDYDDYNSWKELETSIDCAKCNGTGYLIFNSEQNEFIVPKIKKEKK